MIIKVNHGAILPPRLVNLIERCQEAGATAFTVIPAMDKAVLFYKNPQSIHKYHGDEFDELHIQAGRSAVIFIAVFLEDND